MLKTKQSAKGVNRAVKTTLGHEKKYKFVLFNRMAIRELMKVIASKNQGKYVTKVNKIALSAFDIKRFYDDDRISSLAFGPYKRNQTRTVFEKTGKTVSFTNDIVNGTDENNYGDTQNNHLEQSCSENENEESFRSPDSEGFVLMKCQVTMKT